jgi:hypothetical protein
VKIEFENDGSDVIFRISDYDQIIEKALQICFYGRDREAYIKRFPAATPHLEAVKQHYRKHAEEMFLQAVYQRPVPWQAGLLATIERLESSSANWWLTGSCATCIRGVPLNPHDIDIMVDSKDIPELTEIFADVIIEPIINTEDWVTKDFGVLFLHCRIDIASDPQDSLDDPEPGDCGPYARARLEEIVWEGHRVRVPPLELQLQVNRRRQRGERVHLIEQFMEKTKQEAEQ